MANGKKIMYTSDNGNYRVLYDQFDMGMKYRVQKKTEYRWENIHYTDSPLDALNVMKRAAREW